MIDIEFLKSRGYIVTKPTIRIMTSEELRQNLFGCFEYYPKFDFWFIQFPDERIRVRQDGIEGTVFGKCKLGYFLEDNNEGMIRLISLDNNSDDDLALPDLVLVNRNIHEFYICYMIFLASVYYLKSKLFSVDGSYSVDAYLSVVKNKCIDLRRELEQINGALSEGSFWDLLVYMLEDSFFPISLHLKDYSDAGRIDY